MGLNVLEEPLLLLTNEIDGYALAPKPTRPANTVNVIFPLYRQLVINN
jgi:hypothetical protein